MKEARPEPKCWKYEVRGWKIMAGKTDEDNDMLSLETAKPDEHWFHISGLPGSHVILRKPDDDENATADKHLMETAAAVAAWHSKARNGGWCTVNTTLARNVSKPRGAKPGLVEIRDVKSIRVKPALPRKDEPGTF